MSKLYVVTWQVNDYRQWGEYIHSVHLSREKAEAAVPYFGRKKPTTGNDYWYNLHVVEPGDVIQDME